MVGACIGLFLLAIIERWFAASRSLMEVHWAQQRFAMPYLFTENNNPFHSRGSHTGAEHDRYSKDVEGEVLVPPKGGSAGQSSVRRLAGFQLSQDIPRGLMHTVQAGLSYALMLVVM